MDKEHAMRIGIDATPLPSDPGGAGNYIVQLVRALLASPGEHHFVIFIQRGRLRWFDGTRSPSVEWVVTADRPPALRLLWEQTALPWLARHYRLDILHSLHYTRPFILPCASVVTFHDLTFVLFPELHTPLKRRFFPLMMRFSARRSAALLANSESTRQDAMRLLGIPAEKIFLTPLGIGAEFRPLDDPQVLQHCREQYHLPGQFILYVGTLEPRKNLPLLLRAYARLPQRLEVIPLVIAGQPGWMIQDIFRQIEALGIQDRVQFTGYIPAQDLPIVYNLAQVFVYPSLYEGFGFPPLEAMACGTPTITTAVSAMLEQIGDGALLVPPQDEAALAETILKVLDDPKLQQELSARGYRQAARFTWSQTAQATLRVYQQVITPR
jgi:glycosyltransferase involved in cell wall biosynthesis